MASAPRYFAVDDGHFTFEDPDTSLVGVMTRGATTVEAVAVDRITVDGLDANEKVLALVRRLPGAGPDVVLLDGIAFGGFNIVDLAGLHAALGRPVVAITRRLPDRAQIEAAIRGHLPDPEVRIGRLPQGAPARLEVAGKALYVHAAGVDDREATALLRPAMTDGGIPEPLRLAHLLATAITRGVSGTRS